MFAFLRKKAVNETVWVAYGADSAQKKSNIAVAKLSTVDRRTLDFTDIFFGTLGLTFTVLALLQWWKHLVSFET